MKRIFTLLAVLIAFTANAQTLKTRSDGAFTQLDFRLAVSKNFSIPQGATPTLNGGLNTAGQLFWNTTTLTLNIWNGSAWVAVPNDASVVHTTGNETISGAKTFNNTISAPNFVANSGNISIANSSFSGVTNVPNGTYNDFDGSGGASNVMLNAGGTKDLYLKGVNIIIPTLPSAGTTEDLLVISSTGIVKKITQASLGGGSGSVTLTGDVTGSGTGTVATTIAAGSVSLAKMANMATASILGRNTAGTGAPEVLSAATTKSILALNNVENTALSTWTGTSNITTLGTVATGTWSGTTVALNKGGTGQTTATAAFDALSPTTTLGDLIYRGASNNVRLAGNITSAKQFLSQTGTGSVSAAPAWSGIANTDVSGLGSLATASSIDLSTASATGTLAAGRFPALTGDVTTAAGSLATTIANNSVSLAKMATMATASFLGRNTAATGNVEVLSASTAKTILSLNNVENTALSTWAGSSNVTTLGTVTTGTWSGTTIGTSKGGTGLTSIGTSLQVLRTNSGATGLEWATVSTGTALSGLTSDVNISSPADLQLLKYDGGTSKWVNWTPTFAPSTGSTSTAWNAKQITMGQVNIGAGTVIDFDAGAVQYVSISANTTFTMSNAADGKTVQVLISATGADRTIVITGATWMGGPDLTITSGASAIVTLVRINGTVYGTFLE